MSTQPPVKCVVWDLDNTLWHGVLLEDGAAPLREGAAEAVRALDARGIVQSIASRNDEQAATARLKESGLDEYFLVPQIGWGAKSASVRRVAEALNLATDAFLFVDDDAFEREEVGRAHPGIRVADAAEVGHGLLERPELNPAAVTLDGRRRREMYRAQLRRDDAEQDFTGPPEEFLASLDMELTVRHARPDDLPRAEELTVRTHQLNATGYTYSHQELDGFRDSEGHSLLVAALRDRFGDYGTVGLVLVDHEPGLWTLKLLLVSCRVMSRGIGTVLLNHVIAKAADAGVRLTGEFVPTGRNRPMMVAYRFAGFTSAGERGGVTVLEHTAATVPALPGHLRLISEL